MLMTSKKAITFLIIALFTLNLVTLGYLWLGRNHHGDHGPGHEGGPGAFLIRELQLNEEQKEVFEKLKHEHHHLVMQIQDSMHLLREPYFNELNNADLHKADSLERLIGQKQASIEHITFDHFRKVRAICNPEQQKKFDQIIQEALRMMAPPPGGPHDGPPPPRDK
jgi:protein CpxP